jgi:hypothetical protein
MEKLLGQVVRGFLRQLFSLGVLWETAELDHEANMSGTEGSWPKDGTIHRRCKRHNNPTILHTQTMQEPQWRANYRGRL